MSKKEKKPSKKIDRTLESIRGAAGVLPEKYKNATLDQIREIALEDHARESNPDLFTEGVFVLRFTGKRGAISNRDKKKFAALEGTQIIDASKDMLLVKGPRIGLARLRGELKNWTMSKAEDYALPDPKPKPKKF